MVKLLFVMSNLEAGGAERSLVELLARLDRSQYRSTLFLLRRSGIHLDKVPAEVHLRCGVEDGKSVRHNLASVASKLILESEGADIIVGAMEGLPSYLAWLAARVRRKPLIGWVRSELDLSLKPLSPWHLRLARIVYPRCQAVVVPSQGSLHSLNRLVRLVPDRLNVIHNLVNPAEVSSLASRPAPSILSPLRSKPFILAVGRLFSAHKGFDVLIRAHAAVQAKQVDHNLVILGEGSDRDALESLARGLGVSGSVFMPGFQRNPFPFFKAATAFAFPARIDGLARVLLEALILGLPVIASRASGPREVLEDGRHGM
jgi:glycosyltransferase involved in cell wall biosynthesis